MTIIRKSHSKQVKFKAVLSLLKGDRTIAEISQEYGVNQSVLHRWKKVFLEEGPNLFEDQRKRKIIDPTTDLQRKIGELVMENDFLKKALGQ